MLTRRNLLKSSSLLALAPAVPSFLARLAHAVEAKRDDRVLVVIQLDGGNDGINTVVPFHDEGYAKHRRQLRLPEDKLHKLNDEIALHPSMRALAGLFEEQRLAVVQGVGYPNPNRSHDVSMAIWHTARFDRAEHKTYGWLGRALDQQIAAREGKVAPALRDGEVRSPKATADLRHRVSELPGSESPQAMLVGDGTLPAALIGRRSIAGTFGKLEELAVHNEAARDALPLREGEGSLAAFMRRSMLDAYTTSAAVHAAAARQKSGAKYPGNPLAEHLSMIARLIEADMPARVYYAVQRGYDTHAAQLPTHSRLLSEFSAALAAFLQDLTQAGLAERVLVMTFSEFGRRVAENASAGTDHGTAAPMFLAGGAVKGGLFGQAPRLLDLDQGDLKMSLDFRRVYATVLHDWLAIDPGAVLAGQFDSLPVFSAGGAS